MPARGPFRADQIRPGDPYELSNGHALFSPPTGARGGRANLVGAEVLDTDPGVDSAGIDVGISSGPQELRAPDIAVGNVPNEPGWASTAPPLAVEYADTGQDEEALHVKIAELFAAGTKLVWVVRLAGERCVEVHAPGTPLRVAMPGEDLTAPGILQNAVPVEALYDRTAAHEATLRNLLNRKGFKDLDHVREEGRVLGVRAALYAVLAGRGVEITPAQRAAIDSERDGAKLTDWLALAAVATDASALHF